MTFFSDFGMHEQADLVELRKIHQPTSKWPDDLRPQNRIKNRIKTRLKIKKWIKNQIKIIF